jgi:hypothetical protein
LFLDNALPSNEAGGRGSSKYTEASPALLAWDGGLLPQEQEFVKDALLLVTREGQSLIINRLLITSLADKGRYSSSAAERFPDRCKVYLCHICTFLNCRPIFYCHPTMTTL